ncbi:hypothetical protein [Agrobacterium sp. CG674]
MRNPFSDDEDLDVQAVNLTAGIARMTDGTTREITNMFDCDSDDTTDPVAALSAVVKDHDDRWLAIDLLAYDQ